MEIPPRSPLLTAAPTETRRSGRTLDIQAAAPGVGTRLASAVFHCGDRSRNKPGFSRVLSFPPAPQFVPDPGPVTLSRFGARGTGLVDSHHGHPGPASLKRRESDNLGRWERTHRCQMRQGVTPLECGGAGCSPKDIAGCIQVYVLVVWGVCADSRHPNSNSFSSRLKQTQLETTETTDK